MHQSYLYDYLTASSGTPPSINTYIPSVGEFIDETKVLLLAPFGALGFIFIWWKTLRRFSFVILAVILFFLFYSVISPAKDFYHAGMLLVASIPGAAIKLYLTIRYIRFNLLFYGVIAWYSLLTAGIVYLEFEPSICQINGILMIIFGLIPIILALLSWNKERSA